MTRSQQLTTREHQVLEASAFGLSTKEQAKKLGISMETVKDHRAACLRRMGVANMAHAVYLAAKQGLI